MKHLSYRQFKNIFGDWGVTAWVKFNWLSNGLPDGTYNGITKVTIKTVTNINNNKRALVNSVMPIAPADNAVWQYGFASLKVISGNASLQGVTYNNVSVDANGYMFIQIPSIAQTKEAYENYLSKHPVIFYFYDRRQWGGTFINNPGTNGNVMYQSYSSSTNITYGIRDVMGDYSYSGNYAGTAYAKDHMPDMSIGGNTQSSTTILIQDKRYPYTSEGVTKFIEDNTPRAIVYKLSPSTQALSLANEEVIENLANVM